MIHTMMVVGFSLLVAVQGCWLGADVCGQGPDADSDSDSDSDSTSDSDTDTGPDPLCEEVDITIYNDPASVMILLDHSSSMAGSNWDIARNAINDLLAVFSSSSVWFGLDTLPDPEGGDCAVFAPVAVDCGPDTEPTISSTLASMTTVYSTPLYDAMEKLTETGYSPGCMETLNARYILLIADGEDSCSSPPTQAFTALTNLLVEMGNRIIVVGFNVNINSAQLNAIAENGGTEFTSYLNASDGPSLNAALDMVADSIDSCFFTINSAQASAQPDLVNLYFDGVVVPMDEDCSSGHGWRWLGEAHVQIEFCEDSCALLESGEVDEITATFGCETFEG